MQLHTLKRNHSNKRKKRVGRGGLRGKTSGRGHKGQKSRSGRKMRPESRDIIKKIPKMRGHGKHRATSVYATRAKASVVNLGALDRNFQDGQTVSPKTLAERKLIRKNGRFFPDVKILSHGDLSKKLIFSNVSFSAVAKEKVESSGSTIS